MNVSISVYCDNDIIKSAVLLVLPSGKTFYKGTTYSVYKIDDVLSVDEPFY